MERFQGNSLVAIIRGIVISLIMTVLLLFVFAIILTYTNLSEEMIPTVIIVVTAISLLIGSSIANTKINKNGILNGTIIGLVYLLSIYIISSTVRGTFELNIRSIIMQISGMIFGIIGGIIGVNTKK